MFADIKNLQQAKALGNVASLPGSIVGDHRVTGGASDAIVVLEKPQVTPRCDEMAEQLPRWETVNWMIISTETAHVSQSQAEEDFCRSAGDKKQRLHR